VIVMAVPLLTSYCKPDMGKELSIDKEIDVNYIHRNLVISKVS